jgi:hypothetical protein
VLHCPRLTGGPDQWLPVPCSPALTKQLPRVPVKLSTIAALQRSLITLVESSSGLTAGPSRTSVRRCLETTPRAPNALGSVRPNPPDQQSPGSDAYGFLHREL